MWWPSRRKTDTHPDWACLKATTVSGGKHNPLVIAFHGFGQSVTEETDPYLPYFNFPASSQILSEARDRNWSVFMPQAPWFRNWRTLQAIGDRSCHDLVEAAREATGSSGGIHLVGFSDGATLATAFMVGNCMPAFRSVTAYAGSWPDALTRLYNNTRPVVVAWNRGDLKRIRMGSQHAIRELDHLGILVHAVDFDQHGHVYSVDATPTFFNLIEEIDGP